MNFHLRPNWKKFNDHIFQKFFFGPLSRTHQQTDRRTELYFIEPIPLTLGIQLWILLSELHTVV